MKGIKVKKRRSYGKPQQFIQILHLATFFQNILKYHVLKNQHVKNQIVSLTASFTVALQKVKQKLAT